jgi:hypothetical protein
MHTYIHTYIKDTSTVVIDVMILVGLLVVAALQYYNMRQVQELEEVVGQMLYDLGKKGVLNVEIHEDA